MSLLGKLHCDALLDSPSHEYFFSLRASEAVCDVRNT